MFLKYLWAIGLLKGLQNRRQFENQYKRMVCPQMRSATKSKVLRAACDRLIYLEQLYVQLLQLDGMVPPEHQISQSQKQINEPIRTSSPGESGGASDRENIMPSDVNEGNNIDDGNFQQIFQNSYNLNNSIGSSPSNSTDDSFSPVDYTIHSDCGSKYGQNTSRDEISEISLNLSYDSPVYSPQNGSLFLEDNTFNTQNDFFTTNDIVSMSATEVPASVNDVKVAVDEQHDNLQSQAEDFFQQFEAELSNPFDDELMT